MEVPYNYANLVGTIDDKFVETTENIAKGILKEHKVNVKHPVFHWDEFRGLYEFVIDQGRGAMFNQDTDEWVFKNINESHEAIAVYNILAMYLNRLQECVKDF